MDRTGENARVRKGTPERLEQLRRAGRASWNETHPMSPRHFSALMNRPYMLTAAERAELIKALQEADSTP